MEVKLEVKYKLSVLPDESVLDCVALESKSPTEPAQLLACCESGSYVILKRIQYNVLQEVWRFKGFSLPPKGFLVCDQARVLVIEHASLALIDLRKKDITKFKSSEPRGEDAQETARSKTSPLASAS